MLWNRFKRYRVQERFRPRYVKAIRDTIIGIRDTGHQEFVPYLFLNIGTQNHTTEEERDALRKNSNKNSANGLSLCKHFRYESSNSSFYFFMASAVFVKHRMTWFSSHFPLYCRRLSYTCGPFSSPQAISKWKWKQWCLGSPSSSPCRRDRGPGGLTLHRERNLGTRLTALRRKREGPGNDINCCAKDKRRP